MINAEDYSKTHSTKMEIKFINKLGKHSPKKIPRAVLLAGYLMGAYKRTRWADIDDLEIIDYVTNLLVNAIPRTLEVADG